MKLRISIKSSRVEKRRSPEIPKRQMANYQTNAPN